MSISQACNTGNHYGCSKSSCSCTCHRRNAVARARETMDALLGKTPALDFYSLVDEIVIVRDPEGP